MKRNLTTMNHVPGCPLDAEQKSELFARVLGDYDRWIVLNYLKVNRTPIAGAHPWVPIGLELFGELVALALQHARPTPALEEWDARLKQRVCRKPAHHRFVDAGCGTGMTLKLACEIGQQMGKPVEAEGVELQDGMVQYAAKRGFIIHQGDLREFDYRPYNIVYLYQPMAALQDAMTGILDSLRPGAAIIAVVQEETWTSRTSFKVLYKNRGIAVALREEQG
jgi:SAM-dependent methyltransferase